jgi:dTDP-glucose 4,6-dehydratase
MGNWQSAEKFPVKVQRALETGESVIIHGSPNEIGSRYYLHSKRVAHALLDILSRPVTLHKEGVLDEPDKYHITGERNVDNLELAQKIAELMGKELRYTFQDCHKDNPAHDIHYGLADSKLHLPDTFEEDLQSVIEFQTHNP